MAVLFALLVSLLAVRVLSGKYAARLAMDLPNQRSLHTAPIPRTGGLGVAIGVACGWMLVGSALPAPIWLGAAMLIGVSFLDDRYGLPAAARFLVHGVIAVWLTLALGIGAGWAVLSVLMIVWMTNLYNFMDGADGLAGGMAVSGFGVYALIFSISIQGDGGLSLDSAVIAGAALGYLLFNFPPARVFMGDAGSIPLGFLAAAFGLLGIVREAWPVWFPLLVFAPFMLDATVTLARRVLRGEKVWQAHKQHYYQRLIRMGWSHRRTALVEYGLMLASGSVAMLMLMLPAIDAYAVGVLWLLLLAAGMFWTDRRWRSYAGAD